MSRFEGAIFDIDGTLIDSMGLWYQVDVDFFRMHNAEMPADYSKKVARMSAWRTAEYTIALLGLRETPEELIEIWNGMIRDEYLYRVPLKPMAKECITAMKAQGVKLAVATALFPALYEPVLKRTGLYPYFDVFLSSSEIKCEKSQPDLYLMAAERLGVSPSRCVVFEDIVPGIQGAKAAGMFTVGVYDKWDRTSQTALAAAADFYIKDFSDFLKSDWI